MWGKNKNAAAALVIWHWMVIFQIAVLPGCLYVVEVYQYLDYNPFLDNHTTVKAPLNFALQLLTCRHSHYLRIDFLPLQCWRLHVRMLNRCDHLDRLLLHWHYAEKKGSCKNKNFFINIKKCLSIDDGESLLNRQLHLSGTNNELLQSELNSLDLYIRHTRKNNTGTCRRINTNS